MILQIKNLTGGYTKDHDILQGVSLEIAKGDSVGIIGLNGSGKSSFAKAILNILPYRQGEILFNGVDVSKKSTRELSELGIALFMQGGSVFDELSVRDNLLISANNKKEIDYIRKYFISLRLDTNESLKMKADKLSGGERNQLVLAMCMLKKPSLLILDEPSAGLSPNAVNSMYQTLNLLREKEKLTTILIEQNVTRAVEFCSSVNMLRNGKIMPVTAIAAVMSRNMSHNLGSHTLSGVKYQSEDKSLLLKEIKKIMFNN
ncbi:MAG: ATP-binding cassette domain-containing protein [Prevotellaceae bacterium]|jgi:ABC-type branched-subunit amino acid transport system ATPase component|nr:ATP-binding cassette domain-containing protein [Prevotellaceae bacterium]